MTHPHDTLYRDPVFANPLGNPLGPAKETGFPPGGGNATMLVRSFASGTVVTWDIANKTGVIRWSNATGTAV